MANMIYHLSLQTVGIIAGAFLILISLPGLFKPDLANVAQRFPRSHVAGVVLLTISLLWTFWLLATIEMGEFQAFRRPLLIALPIGYALVLRFVDEFLAVRALGILCLLAVEPLLDAALTAARCGVFALRNEPVACDRICLLACRRRLVLGHDAVFASRSN